MSKGFRKLSIFLVLVLVFALLFTGCSKTTNRKVKLMEVTHSLFYTPQYVAITQGFFEEEGLEIELINGGGADKVMAALSSGEVEIGFMGLEASVYVYNQSRDNYAINFAQLTQRDGSFLVGREKDDNFTFDKVKGKTIIGGRKGGMPEMTLEYVLKSHGLKLDEDVVVRTDVQFDAMAGAFLAGEGDFVTLFEPVASSLEKEGKGYVVASIGREGGYIPYTGYSTTKKIMESDPELVQKFTNALYKGLVWVQNSSTEEIAKAVKPQFPDTEDDVLMALIDRYRDQDSWKPDLLISEDGFNHLMDIMELAGELDKRADYDKIVNTEFVEKAMKK